MRKTTVRAHTAVPPRARRRRRARTGHVQRSQPPAPPEREGRGKNKIHRDVFCFQAGPEESRLATETDNSPSPVRRAGRFPARLGTSFWGRFQAFPPSVPSHMKEWMVSSAMPGQGWPGTAEGEVHGAAVLPGDAEHPVMVGRSLGWKEKAGGRGDMGSGWRQPAHWPHAVCETWHKVSNPGVSRF